MPELDDKSTLQLLTGKVETIERTLDNLGKVTRQGKWTGRLMILLVALAALFSLWRTYTTIRGFPPQLYAHYASQEALKLQPVVEKHLSQLVEDLAPAYSAAFQKEISDQMPEIAEKANEQATLYLNNIGDALEVQLSKALEGLVRRHADALAKDYPELKDDQVRNKVFDKVQEIYYSAAQDVAKEVFGDQTKALADLGATVETFNVPAELKEMNDEKLVQYTRNTVTKLLARRLNFLDIPEAAPEPAPVNPQGRQSP